MTEYDRTKRRDLIMRRRAQRVLRDGRLVSEIAPPHAHGRAVGYQTWSCRCEACSDWSTRRDRQHAEIWVFNQQIIDRLAAQRRAPSAPCVEKPTRQPQLEPAEVHRPVETPKPVVKPKIVPPKPVEPPRPPIAVDEIKIGTTEWTFDPTMVPPLIPAVRERVKTVGQIEAITRAYHQPDWSSPGGPEDREKRVYGNTQIVVATDGNVIWWSEREVAKGESELLTAAPKGLPKAKGGGVGTRVPTTAKELEKMLKQAGCEIEPTGSGHIRVSRDGKTIIMPSTASDWRSLANVIGQARRKGLM